MGQVYRIFGACAYLCPPLRSVPELNGDRRMKHSLSTPAFSPDVVCTAFQAAIAAAGLGRPEILPNGKIQRFHVDGDEPSSRNGYYLLDLYSRPWGFYGTWKRDKPHYFFPQQQARLTPGEENQLRKEVEFARKKYEVEKLHRLQRAAEIANFELQRSNPASPDHPYLVAKKIQPHSARVDSRNNLLIPIKNEREQVVSLQTIKPDPNSEGKFLKLNLADGQVKGCWCFIEGTDSTCLLVAEGFATGATLSEVTGNPVFCALSCHNLVPVTKAVRVIYPHTKIIVCADNDQWTQNNPGVTKAVEAARKYGAQILIPDFTGMDVSSKPTDWNDWFALRRQMREVA